MEMQFMTMVEFEKGLERTRSVAVPFGSLEEHGTHLPLGTDTLHALEVCRRTAALRPIFIAPPVWYGLCRSTSQHPGTCSINGLTLRRLCLDIIESLYTNGLNIQVLLSGHAGGTHMSYLIDAAEEAVRKHHDLRCAVLSIIDLIKDSASDIVETPGDSHAGEAETSIIKSIDETLVKGAPPSEYPAFPKYIITREKIKYWPGGIWGDPTKASNDKGEKILQNEAQRLSKLFEELETKR